MAFTGYGRIATLGEEVRDPRRAIPRAIVLALVATLVIYAAVVGVAVAAVGAPAVSAATPGGAPLELVAARLAIPEVRHVIAIAAITAMAGVLLNLILGLSRVLFAMGRRGDGPPVLARVDERGGPRVAIVVIGVAIAGLVLIGNVKTTWSFSAFTVLVYYAITNLAALRLPRAERRFPRAIAVVGLASCLGLAFWVEPIVWLAGLAVIAAGLLWFGVVARRWRAAA